MTDDLDRLNAVASPHATVAGKIRALAAAGVPRADIARFLGKRYQHVRNVLEGDAQAGGYGLGQGGLGRVQERARPFDRGEDGDYIERRSATAFWLEVKSDGSLPLSKEIAELLGAEPGRRVFARIKDGRLTLMSGEAAMDEARAIVRRIIPPEIDLVESLLADRRAEVAREVEDD